MTSMLISLQVCELHFLPEQIEWETSATDPRTGVIISAKLQIPRLAKGSVPTQLPGCPSYLSTTPDKPRLSREEKSQAAADAQLARALGI